MRIISPDQLVEEWGIDFTNPYRLELEAAGKFPKRVRIGARRYGYLPEELEAWLKDRAALRNTAA
jgi:prophage regulatory protein